MGKSRTAPSRTYSGRRNQKRDEVIPQPVLTPAQRAQRQLMEGNPSSTKGATAATPPTTQVCDSDSQETTISEIRLWSKVPQLLTPIKSRRDSADDFMQPSRSRRGDVEQPSRPAATQLRDICEIPTITIDDISSSQETVVCVERQSLMNKQKVQGVSQGTRRNSGEDFVEPKKRLFGIGNAKRSCQSSEREVSAKKTKSREALSPNNDAMSKIPKPSSTLGVNVISTHIVVPERHSQPSCSRQVDAGAEQLHHTRDAAPGSTSPKTKLAAHGSDDDLEIFSQDSHRDLLKVIDNFNRESCEKINRERNEIASLEREDAEVAEQILRLQERQSQIRNNLKLKRQAVDRVLQRHEYVKSKFKIIM